MMLTPAWTKLRPHKVQRRLWGNQVRFPVIPAGRGSGKTELLKRYLVRCLPIPKPWPDPKYFYAGPTVQQAKKVAWEHLIALTPQNWVEKINHSDLYIETIWKSKLYLIGLDKPMRMEGPQYDGGGLDENSDIKPGTFKKTVVPALTHRNGFCWRTGVPKRQGIGAAEYKQACLDAQNPDIPDMEYFWWPSSDILTPDQLAFAKANLDPKDFREQFEAHWETAGGGIFHSFDRQYNVRPCPYRPDKSIIIGSDFNVDPMCWVLGHRWENRMEWFDELFIRDCNTAKALDVTYQKYQSHQNGVSFFGDATGKARKSSAFESDYKQIRNHEGFKKLNREVHYAESNPAVADRFASCNAMLCNADGDRRMFIDPSCVHLISDLESRYFKEGTREVADSGDLGHMTDAMGYPVHMIFPMRVLLEALPQPIIMKARP